MDVSIPLVVSGVLATVDIDWKDHYYVWVSELKPRTQCIAYFGYLFP